MRGVIFCGGGMFVALLEHFAFLTPAPSNIRPNIICQTPPASFNRNDENLGICKRPDFGIALTIIGSVTSDLGSVPNADAFQIREQRPEGW